LLERFTVLWGLFAKREDNGDHADLSRKQFDPPLYESERLFGDWDGVIGRSILVSQEVFASLVMQSVSSFTNS